MEEPYIEGVAIHGGPESCSGVREGVGEALTGVRAGQATEPWCGPKAAVPAGESPASVITQSVLKLYPTFEGGDSSGASSEVKVSAARAEA